MVAVVLIVGAVAVTLTVSPRRPAVPVTLASGPWDPFSGPQLEGGGPMARIVTETLRQQGLEPDVEFSSWPVALERTSRGEVLGAFALIANDERRAEFLVSDPIFEFDYVLFHHVDRVDPSTLRTAADVSELRVGRVSGYAVWEELDRAVERFTVFESSAEAFEALAAGEIDLLPEGLLSGRAVVESAAISMDARTFGVVDSGGKPLLGATESLHLLASPSPQTRQVLRRFNEDLADVVVGDFYREITAELIGGARATVELIPLGSGELVRTYANSSGRPEASTPAGTRGAVLEWPRFDQEPGSEDAPFVQVKLLSGPGRGHVVYVDARSIVLEGVP